MEKSAACGLTECGTSLTRIGVLRGPTRSFTNSSHQRSLAAIITRLPSPARIFRCLRRICPAGTPPASIRSRRERSSAGNRGNDEQLLGIQYYRPSLQEHGGFDPLCGARGGKECEFPFECRADAEWRDSAGVCRAPDGNGEVDQAIRAVRLWNAWWSRACGALGRDDRAGFDRLRACARLESAVAGAGRHPARRAFGEVVA